MCSPCSCRTAPCSRTMSFSCGASNAKSFAGSEAKSRLRLPVRERSSSALSFPHRPSRNRANARRSDNAPNLPAALVSHLRAGCLCGIRQRCCQMRDLEDRKSTRLNSSHGYISYAVFCLKKKKKKTTRTPRTQIDETHEMTHLATL